MISQEVKLHRFNYYQRIYGMDPQQKNKTKIISRFMYNISKVISYTSSSTRKTISNNSQGPGSTHLKSAIIINLMPITIHFVTMNI